MTAARSEAAARETQPAKSASKAQQAKTPSNGAAAQGPARSNGAQPQGATAQGAAGKGATVQQQQAAVQRVVAPDGRVGRIISVSGSRIVALIEHQVVAGDGQIRELEIGEVVKIRTRRSIVFGIVSAVEIPTPGQTTESGEMKIAAVDLLGESDVNEDGKPENFRRGATSMPALGNVIYTVPREDLAQVYASTHHTSVRVGTVHQDRSLPAYVATDGLLGKHFAVLGTTGAGKSCAVALILRAILDKYPNGHIIMLDMHNEYGQAFGDRAEILNPLTLELPYWLLNFEEISEVVIGAEKEHREAMSGILGEVVLAAKRAFAGNPSINDQITVDTPVPYRIGELMRLMDDAVGALEKGRDTAPFLRLKARFETLTSDPRYGFMFPGLNVQDKMASILSQLFRVPVFGRPITLIDLSGVPSEILNVVAAVLCRMTFEFALWTDRAIPVLLVCEEAHRYVPQETGVGFEPTKRILARIAKEGRKYGVSLGLVSQRPSELAVEVLSQCNTIFALRMSNQKDQEFVRAALPDSSMGMIEFLPSLGAREAMAMGEGVPVPLRLVFDELPEEFRPRSGTASFSAVWSQDLGDEEYLNAIVALWRSQGRSAE